MAITADTRPRGQTVQHKDPRTIKVMPNLNARDMNSVETRQHIETIAASIEAQGFLGSHPLETFWEGGETYVAAGHCRLAACLLVIERGTDIRTIPCLSEARGTSPEQRLINQITSNSGQRLNLAEEGKIYHRLIAMGFVISKIAKDAGKSETHIRQALDFNAAPTEAHAMVSEGKVSATLAAETIRKEGATKGVKTLKAAVKTAEKEGKTKATKRHVELKPSFERDPAPACISLVKRIAKLDDPSNMEAAETVGILIRIVHDAKAIFVDARIPEAAE